MGSSLIAAKAAWIAVFLAVVAASTLSRPAEIDAVAAVHALNAELLVNDSATEVLGRLCASHHLADPPLIKALRDTSVDKPADRRIRAFLRLGVDEPVRYRRVELVCGSHVLSNADNWYVPSRLTAEMNRQLDETNTPFGLVVKPLGYHRVRLATTLLLQQGKTPSPGQGVLRHEALLVTPSGLPLSFVAETYTPEVTIINPSDR